MVEFDFESSGAGTGVGTSGTNNFSVQLTFTDAVNDTGGSVKFSVSYSGFYSVPGPAIGFISANLSDFPSEGIFFSNFATTVSNNSTLSAASQSLSFQLRSPTISGNSVFTGKATLETFSGNTFTTSAFGGDTISFNISSLGFGATITSLKVNLACFCAGTQVATPGGTSAIETLQPGDLVRLTDGRDVAVRWVGRQHVDTRLHHPKMVNPICITAGALGGGLPERDLRVSADHGICIDGVLINAGAMVNGTTIYQERDVSLDGFTYYHVETDAHELIVAEGVAAESFIDYEARDAFDNAHEGPDRAIQEMPLPRISSARMLPDHIKRRIEPLIAAE